MTKQKWSYTVTASSERLSERCLRTYSVRGSSSKNDQRTSKFVAFPPFDGQSLAGTGALVFEGEILPFEVEPPVNSLP
ncbi:MAG: hypothetical protein AAF217_03105 [Pseudomonadota bacterium]